MVIFTTCKINIGLNIIARRPDGYHDISTLMVPVNWGDIIEIVPSNGNVTTLTTYGRHVNCPTEQNLIMKAYNALASISNIPPVDIYLDKVVPDGAGLGGGSADASFTLKALNAMFELGFSNDRLAEIAATIGADCPLFIYNKPMLASGTGTTLDNVDIDLSAYYILIVKSDIKISTREAYMGVKPAPWNTPLEQMLPDIISHKPLNDFEPSMFASYPLLASIKQELYNSGAVYSSMSGSGSAIFGLFTDVTAAQDAIANLPDNLITHICRPV